MSHSSDRADCLQLAGALRPVLLEERWHQWRRMGLGSSAASEAVSQSFGHPMPLDGDGRAGDALDRRINTAEKAFAHALEEARRQLDLALAIQQGWLTIKDGRDVTAHIATKEERAQASDLGVDCLACSRPVACTPVDPIREGFCEACSRRWRRQGKPDRVWFIRQTQLGTPEEAVSG